ncbi:hypothetical protein F2981_12050 [Sinorhizobium meliloti]|nr:hypothetical protein [Sinorhizobium meliloti]
MSRYEEHRLGKELDGDTYLRAGRVLVSLDRCGRRARPAQLDPLIGSALQEIGRFPARFHVRRKSWRRHLRDTGAKGRAGSR